MAVRTSLIRSLLPAACLVAALASMLLPSAAFGVDTLTVYRLYNPISSEHLYTTSHEEYTALVDHGWQQEGEAWQAPTSSSKPVYRLYNETLSDHHYTADAKEAESLVNDWGWVYDFDKQPVFYSAENIESAFPAYRLYNGKLEHGQHHYTVMKSERLPLVRENGWTDEQVGWYGIVDSQSMQQDDSDYSAMEKKYASLLVKTDYYEFYLPLSAYGKVLITYPSSHEARVMGTDEALRSQYPVLYTTMKIDSANTTPDWTADYAIVGNNGRLTQTVVYNIRCETAMAASLPDTRDPWFELHDQCVAAAKRMTIYPA